MTPEDKERFFVAYRANFGRITADDGLALYYAWIDEHDIGMDDLIAAMERLGLNWNRQRDGLPRLPDIKRGYDKYGQAPVDTREKCGLCDNRGDLLMVMGGESPDRTEPLNHPSACFYLYEHSIPCRCAKGRALNRRRARQPGSNPIRNSSIETLINQNYTFCDIPSMNKFLDKCIELRKQRIAAMKAGTYEDTNADTTHEYDRVSSEHISGLPDRADYATDDIPDF